MGLISKLRHFWCYFHDESNLFVQFVIRVRRNWILRTNKFHFLIDYKLNKKVSSTFYLHENNFSLFQSNKETFLTPNYHKLRSVVWASYRFSSSNSSIVSSERSTIGGASKLSDSSPNRDENFLHQTMSALNIISIPLPHPMFAVLSSLDLRNSSRFDCQHLIPPRVLINACNSRLG